MIAERFMGIIEAGLELLGLVKEVHTIPVKQVVDAVENPEQKEDAEWATKVEHLKNIINNHTDLDARIAAGIELVEMYIEKKDYESLMNLAEDEDVPEIVRETAGWEVIVKHVEEGNVDALIKITDNSWLSEEVIENAGYNILNAGLNEIERCIEEKDESSLKWLTTPDIFPPELNEAAGKGLVKIYTEMNDRDSLMKMAEDNEFSDKTRYDAGVVLLERYTNEKDFKSLEKMRDNEKLPISVRRKAADNLKSKITQSARAVGIGRLKYIHKEAIRQEKGRRVASR